MPQVTSRNRFFLAALAVLLVLATLPLAAQQRVDLSRLVVVGDSLSAGYQNGSLLETQQVNGYANLVAKQTGVPLFLPLIKDPGVPPVLQLVSVNPLVILPSTDPIPSMPRVDPLQQATDLAVPGANVSDALNKVPFAATTDDYVMTNLVLGFPGALAMPPVLKTQVQWAQALQPTTIILWIGNNDALGAAISGNDNFTPVPEFADSYGKVVDALASTKATLVIANIPDVTSIPFLFSVPKLAALFGVPEAVIMFRLGLQPGDYVTLDFLSDAATIVQTGTGALPDNAVLTATEAANVSAAVDAYNLIIKSEAQRVGAALVDIHELFADIGQRGYVVNGQRLNTGFLGGIFSLDGIHPTNTGYAVVANEFIKTMNRTFDVDIPPVAVAKIAKTDPLILPGVGHPAKAFRKGSLDPMHKVLTH
jgi:GDSL-like Lipase/Acylhydrolase